MQYRNNRFPADTDVRVLLCGENKSAQLVNVSTTGARLGQIEGVSLHAAVTLAYLHYRFSAKVIWIAGSLTGIRFLVPLSLSDLNTLRREGSRTSGRYEVPKHPLHGFRELA